MKNKLKSLLILLAAVALVLLNQTGLLGDLPGAPVKTTETAGVVETVVLPETSAAELPDAQAPPETQAVPESETAEETPAVVEDGKYTSKDEVALYIHQFGHLPDNYISKDKAQSLGWVNKEGNLWKVAPGKSIGGDYFGNYEEALPKKKGRKYYECDIDFDGKYRNAKRILFSNDGLIYYTDDHYETFTLLYGEE